MVFEFQDYRFQTAEKESSAAKCAELVAEKEAVLAQLATTAEVSIVEIRLKIYIR